MVERLFLAVPRGCLQFVFVVFFWSYSLTVFEIIKLSYLSQRSMGFILLINVKMPAIVGILTFINRTNMSSRKRSFLSVLFFFLSAVEISCSVEHEKRLITSGPDCYPIANTEHVDKRVLAYTF